MFTELSKTDQQILDNFLKTDIIARYHNDEYWDEDVIVTFFAMRQEIVGYCSNCYAEVIDLHYCKGSGTVLKDYCRDCNKADVDVLEELPKSEIAAQKADIANDERKLGF